MGTLKVNVFVNVCKEKGYIVKPPTNKYPKYATVNINGRDRIVHVDDIQIDNERIKYKANAAKSFKVSVF